MKDHDNIPVELRCGCGSLIARVLKEGVEIKCRRCKQVTIIPLAAPAEVKK
jgi:phage FluMu protein Com